MNSGCTLTVFFELLEREIDDKINQNVSKHSKCYYLQRFKSTNYIRISQLQFSICCFFLLSFVCRRCSSTHAYIFFLLFHFTFWWNKNDAFQQQKTTKRWLLILEIRLISENTWVVKHWVEFAFFSRSCVFKSGVTIEMRQVLSKAFARSQLKLKKAV